MKIYKIGRAFDLWVWLCGACLGKRLAAGWDKRETKEPPHPITCDDCEGDH